MTLKNSAGSQILRIDQNSIRTTTTHNITLFTDGNSNQLRLSSDGNVGIGTASPGARLHVQGTESKFSAPSPTSDAHYLRLKYDNSEGIVDANRGNLKLQANSDIVYTSNKFGIGTTSPFTNLTVYGATDSRIALVNSNTGTSASDGFVLIAEADSDVHFLNREDSDMFFSTNGTKKMTILSDGNVGIGTTSPDNKVHILESALSARSASNSNTSLTLEHATDTGIQFFSATQTQLRFGDAASTAAGAIIYRHDDDNFKLNFANGGHLTINDGSAEICLLYTSDAADE